MIITNPSQFAHKMDTRGDGVIYLRYEIGRKMLTWNPPNPRILVASGGVLMVKPNLPHKLAALNYEYC